MQDRRLLIVTDGLIASGESFAPHPELYSWQKQLNAAAQKWFGITAATPLEWYARIIGATPASLALNLFPSRITSGYSQLWIASPFHARLMRDRLQVMPDALFPWQEDDSRWLCDLLNPLLAEEGMKLVYVQGCMALLCREEIDAHPFSFAYVSGHSLPNRHPDGADGGRLMRLLSEIQMLLRQRPCPHRKQREQPDVDGIWLWGGGDISPHTTTSPVSVASRNPWLKRLSDGREANLVITEADLLHQLCREGAPLPAPLLLAGERHAVLLSRSFLPRFGKVNWTPSKAMDSDNLSNRLRGMLDAA